MNFSSRHAAWEDRELDLHLGGWEEAEKEDCEPDYFLGKDKRVHCADGKFASKAEARIFLRYGRDMYDPDMAKGGHDYDRGF